MVWFIQVEKMVWFILVEKMGSPSYPDRYLEVILTLLESFLNPNLEVTLTLIFK